MVDLAVPRDIEPEVADLEDVYLFSIDDLQKLVDENRQQREVAAGGAQAADRRGGGAFSGRIRAHEAGPAIRALRPQAEEIRAQPSSRRGACSPPADPRDEVIEYLANTLTNRLLHAPDPGAAPGVRIGGYGARRGITRLLLDDRDRQAIRRYNPRP